MSYTLNVNGKPRTVEVEGDASARSEAQSVVVEAHGSGEVTIRVRAAA